MNKLLSVFLVALSFITASIILENYAQAEVVFKQKFKSFTVSGKNSDQLFRSFQKNSPLKATGPNNATLGVAGIRFTPLVDFETKGSRCRVASSKVIADVEIHLPRWANYRSADRMNRKLWDDFVADIKTHELVHADIAREYAGRMDRKILSMNSRSSCEAMEAAVTRAATRVLDQHDRAQRKFDRKDGQRFFGNHF